MKGLSCITIIKLHFLCSRIFNVNLLIQKITFFFPFFSFFFFFFSLHTYQNFFKTIVILRPSIQKALANRIRGIAHLAGTTYAQSTGRNMQQGQHCQKSGWGYKNKREMYNGVYFFHFSLLSMLLLNVKSLFLSRSSHSNIFSQYKISE